MRRNSSGAHAAEPLGQRCRCVPVRPGTSCTRASPSVCGVVAPGMLSAIVRTGSLASRCSSGAPAAAHASRRAVAPEVSRTVTLATVGSSRNGCRRCGKARRVGSLRARRRRRRRHNARRLCARACSSSADALAGDRCSRGRPGAAESARMLPCEAGNDKHGPSTTARKAALAYLNLRLMALTLVRRHAAHARAPADSHLFRYDITRRGRPSGYLPGPCREPAGRSAFFENTLRISQQMFNSLELTGRASTHVQVVPSSAVFCIRQQCAARLAMQRGCARRRHRHRRRFGFPRFRAPGGDLERKYCGERELLDREGRTIEAGSLSEG